MPQSKGKHEPIPSNEWGQLRSYLAQQKVRQATIKEVIGTGALGRRREEICDALRKWMKELPKAGTLRPLIAPERVRAGMDEVVSKVILDVGYGIAKLRWKLFRR